MDFWWTNAQGKNHQITSIHPFNTPSCLEVVEISRAKLLAPFHRPSSAISEAVNGSSPWMGHVAGMCVRNLGDGLLNHCWMKRWLFFKKTPTKTKRQQDQLSQATRLGPYFSRKLHLSYLNLGYAIQMATQNLLVSVPNFLGDFDHNKSSRQKTGQLERKARTCPILGHQILRKMMFRLKPIKTVGFSGCSDILFLG